MSDETAPQPRIKIAWLIGTLAAFALFAVIGAYSSRMTWDTTDYDQDRAVQRYDTLKKLQHDEQALLDPAVDAQGKPHAEWIDQAKGLVRIPIEEAMVRELDTLKGIPLHQCELIPGAAPAAPASTNAATAAVPPSAGATNAAPATAAAPSAKTNAAPTGAGPAPATAKPKPSNK